MDDCRDQMITADNHREKVVEGAALRRQVSELEKH